MSAADQSSSSEPTETLEGAPSPIAGSARDGAGIGEPGDGKSSRATDEIAAVTDKPGEIAPRASEVPPLPDDDADDETLGAESSGAPRRPSRLERAAVPAPTPPRTSSPGSLGLGARPTLSPVSSSPSSTPPISTPPISSSPSSSSPSSSSPSSGSPSSGSPSSSSMGRPPAPRLPTPRSPTAPLPSPAELSRPSPVIEESDEPTTREAARPAAVADADATVALAPPSPDPAASSPPTPSSPFSPRRLPPTASALHEEDEDGPTMVNYLQPTPSSPTPSSPAPPRQAHDEEATAVHPSRGPFPVGTGEPPPSRGPLPTPTDLGFPGMLSPRQAAVEQALAAAKGDREQALDSRLEQQLVAALATLFGVGLLLSALDAYLMARAIGTGQAAAGASLAGANVVCCISLFAAGFASLQREQRAKIALACASALMLFIGFLWMLVAALG